MHFFDRNDYLDTILQVRLLKRLVCCTLQQGRFIFFLLFPFSQWHIQQARGPLIGVGPCAKAHREKPALLYILGFRKNLNEIVGIPLWTICWGISDNHCITCTITVTCYFPFVKTLLQQSDERRIIISCFDSDACIMLKKKQNRFPILFLTQGQSQKYPPYKDFRWILWISVGKLAARLLPEFAAQ